MKIWDDITTTALLGVERSAAFTVDGDTPLSAALAQLESSDPETRLLTAAALASVYRRGGAIPQKNASAPEIVAAEPDSVYEASPHAAHLLEILLQDSQYRELVAEALDLLASIPRRIPTAMLPDFLDLGRQDTKLRERICRVIGRRGFWLAAQNPEWSYVERVTLSDGSGSVTSSGSERYTPEWSLSTREQRIAMLTALGRRDPADARLLLQSTWAQESADDRAALLGARASSLTPDDEAFLEAALDDRSVGVRQTASDLLARLPDSAFVRRMIDRATKHIHVNYRFGIGHTLAVTLPQELDESMQRDQIDSGLKGGGANVDQGRKSGWLRTIVASVPPSHWTAAFDQSPTEFFNLVLKSEWATTLTLGLIEAVGRFGADPAWAMAILRGLTTSTVPVLDINALAPAIRRMPRNDLEKIILDLLGRAPLGAPTLLPQLLELYPEAWPESLAVPLVEKIRRTLAEYSDHQTASAVSALLRLSAMKMPPSMADGLAAAGQDIAQNSYQHRIVEQAISTLRMRGDLRDAILEKTV